MQIVAVVQDVNAVRDLWDWVALAASVIGSFAAAWALWYAVRTKRDIIDERRRLFQLDVLREIAAGVDDGFLFKIGSDPLRLRKFARRRAALIRVP